MSCEDLCRDGDVLYGAERRTWKQERRDESILDEGR